ncbi:hypothetical protein [Bradyrhizobium septentrionale]|uniref:Uncharacterized protein n=1 Tax=Bradyrhizobium septentrionale TaxID=1404411 RepID=A0A973W4G2_9BRAD|nr:hypothetical protein [Bradyrhizobium septentrionale]UGY15971.1 hypothetical protein HAP48_0047070 [Bradyrhizobium septentrionale]UGY24546.1 hypothetical protein HU675_0042700 [Bradyrhizobium septentrionale]
MLMHIVYSLPRAGAETAAKSAKMRMKSPGTAAERRNMPHPRRSGRIQATHIPQSETICSQYDNDAEREPKVGLSRAAQRIGFALWVIAYGAFARYPSLSVTGSH